MTVILAPRTVLMIDAAIKADQGAAYRVNLGKVIPHMDDAYRGAEDGFRSHLGGSVVGNECSRAIWYGFRWTGKAQFGGRTLRLFNRGHLEEARFIAMLLTIGVQVYQQDEHGKQFRIYHAGGHMGGAGDGVGINVPDVPPGLAILLEFKTHNDASFKKLAGDNWKDYLGYLEDPKAFRKPVEFTGDGVRESKFEHYVQTQVYMRKMGLPAALYLAVNKNDDLLYGEILQLDTSVGDQFLDRGQNIIFLKTPPKKMNESAAFYKCKWCDHYKVCHQDAAPAVNCRTCKFSEPQVDGSWLCNNDNRRKDMLNPETNPLNEDFSLSKERQLIGCGHYQVLK